MVTTSSPGGGLSAVEDAPSVDLPPCGALRFLIDARAEAAGAMMQSCSHAAADDSRHEHRRAEAAIEILPVTSCRL
jgi:hypothetical protein